MLFTVVIFIMASQYQQLTIKIPLLSFFDFRMLQKEIHSVWTWSHLLEFIESCIERLTICKANHFCNLSHVQFDASLICKQCHCVINTIGIYKGCKILMKASVYDSANITRVGVQIFCKLLGRIIFVLVLFLHYNLGKDSLLKLVHHPWTNKRPVFSLLGLQLVQVILYHKNE